MRVNGARTLKEETEEGTYAPNMYDLYMGGKKSYGANSDA